MGPAVSLRLVQDRDPCVKNTSFYASPNCKSHLCAAEKFLESVEKNQNYSVLLLHLMDKEDADIHIRISSAITFKNYIKRNWRIVSTQTLNVRVPLPLTHVGTRHKHLC